MSTYKTHVLVTGGAGYIGSILVPALLKEGYKVTVIDVCLYGQASLLDVMHEKVLHVVYGDVRNEQLIAKHIRNADIIIPLAALVGAPLCERLPLESQAVNVDAIQTILRLRSRGQSILFPTTNSGYGIGEEGIHCTEETPLRPVSLYGRQKVEAERLILESGDAITFRFATAFGISPRMRLDLLVNDFVYRAVRDRYIVLFEAGFKRNYVHVRDIARAFLHAIAHFDDMKDEPYNVGLSNANLSKRELCEEIKKQVSDLYVAESDINEDEDKRNYIVSNAKIEHTGFYPEICLQEGISELIKGYQFIRNEIFSNV
ncbi:MAG: hypothetical protein COU47_00825 [Candidatus Niyogibacteria bacterium CG10_big_fil_rev_8_21_14_0_10_46_36]|uniref:NAD-dependent epimerase/dehydratase domain-containing protein n=1 Tax=Candidatus Niyogibacteria bacterium CG10_big_fil_rev_8_21_14_0_10_46_36 TaxID=1974726 RepID=A0A2H0TEJ0_9BACT|nr:MAG: hypothetical protein COU47_00825 [Candidatus Niyogibacteria bacterium CG10_big_fil_rev_8_21_14_0_10_46_36]